VKDLPKWTHEIPSIPHPLLNDAANLLTEFYKEHIQRDIEEGKLAPANCWTLLRGLLIAAMQTYASICLLLADKRPKPLMMQASILCRAMVETLATVLALTEKPEERALVLRREWVKMLAVKYKREYHLFGDEQKWKEYLEVSRQGLTIILEEFGLPPEVLSDPGLIKDEWPTPGVMLWGSKKKALPSFVTGSRHAVLKEIYETHYAIQSAQAHARMAAVSIAFLVDQPEEQWNPGQGESNIVVTALLCLACILSEIEVSGGYSSHAKLAELWFYLRDMDDESKDVWALRYDALVKNSS